MYMAGAQNWKFTIFRYFLWCKQKTFNDNKNRICNCWIIEFYEQTNRKAKLSRTTQNASFLNHVAHNPWKKIQQACVFFLPFSCHASIMWAWALAQWKKHFSVKTRENDVPHKKSRCLISPHTRDIHAGGFWRKTMRDTLRQNAAGGYLDFSSYAYSFTLFIPNVLA